MTFSTTSAISPAFPVGAGSGASFPPAVLSTGSRPKAEVAKPASSATPVADASTGSPSSASLSLSGSAASVKSPSTKVALAHTASASATSPSARAQSAAAASAKSDVKKPDLGEDGEIRLLKAQGENLSQIASDMSISVADVNGDLETNIPKPPVSTPVSTPQDTTTHSTISVFA